MYVLVERVRASERVSGEGSETAKGVLGKKQGGREKGRWKAGRKGRGCLIGLVRDTEQTSKDMHN